MVVPGELDLCTESLWKGSVDGIAEQENCDVCRDGCPICGVDECPGLLSVEGRGSWSGFRKQPWGILEDDLRPGVMGGLQTVGGRS